MKKKSITVAVAGAFLGIPPVVMAQVSTVQVYGKITAEYSYVDQGTGKKKTDFLQTPTSAIGIKGEEKLGGGLSTWFQCESTADIRGQSPQGFCTRNSALGFKGGFGNVYIGKWDTPFKRAFNIGTVGIETAGVFDASVLLTSGATGADGGAKRALFLRRQHSMISYDSPSFSGFKVMAGYSTANAATGALNTTTNAKPRVISLGATYNNGPLALGAAYEKHNQFGTVASAGNDKGWALSGAYTFMGKIKVGGVYTKQDFDIAPGSSSGIKAFSLGVEWAIQGPHGLAAGYTKVDDVDGTVGATPGGNRPGAGLDTGAKLYQIAYTHAFSKRTNAKLGYVKLDNDSKATYQLGGLADVGTAGAQQNAWVMLLSHKF